MNNLINKRVLLFAPELEKKEHRGIAVYTKSLINALFKSGAEIWLVTSLNTKNLRIDKFNKSSMDYIYTSEILQLFYLGNDNNLNYNEIYKDNFLLRIFLGFLKGRVKFIIYFLNIIKLLKQGFIYNQRNTSQIKFYYKNDNPYLKLEKLKFMENISGFISAPNIGSNLKLTSILPILNKIKIDLYGFDFFITSEPLNIISKNKTSIFQTIHDLIPLEFSPEIFSVKSFYNKIKICNKSNKLFISETTKNKFNYLLKNKFSNNIDNENVLIQPPSLIFEKSLSVDNNANILNTISLENKKINKRIKKYKKTKLMNTLKPFNYFLFNSSIDERKNVHLLIESYINSDAQKSGINLVITGKLKNDAYSIKIKDLIKNNYGIHSTGFVNESQKSALYLNSIGLLSPSIIEGFGIPVLDACCLGLNCFASDCSSHREIQNLFDFKKFLNIYPANALTNWSDIFYNYEYLKDINKTKSIEKRLLRYKYYSKILEDNFKLKLTTLINKLSTN